MYECPSKSSHQKKIACTHVEIYTRGHPVLYHREHVVIIILIIISCRHSNSVKKTKRLTLEVPIACHQLAKVSAAAMGITIQEMVYHLVCRYLAEKAGQEPQMMAIRETVLGKAEIEELPSNVCTYVQKEELVNTTLHKLPWE